MKTLDQKIKNPKKKDSSCDTLYRVTLRNQLKSIAIADQKAKVIIGINTILIFLFQAVIGLVSNVTELHFVKNLSLSLPFTIMIICCFVSGALAILVVRPDNRLWNKENPSTLSFRDFHALDLGGFLDDMEKIQSSRKNIQRSLNIDLFLYGRCVQRKNKLLRHSYTVFLAGISLAVISFFILRIVGPATL